MNTILVIGGTSDIRENLVKRFHQIGKQLIVTGRQANKLVEMEKYLPDLKTCTMYMKNLSTTPKDVENHFSKFPEIDTVWINDGTQSSSSIKGASSTSDKDN